MKQIIDKTPTELQYPERFWNFELGTDINVPIWIFSFFQQSDRQHDQNLNNDTFCRLPVTTAQCIIGTEKYPDVGILSNYNDDDYAPAYFLLKEAPKAMTNDNILMVYIIESDFRSFNDDDDIGYNVHACDIRYQNFSMAVHHEKLNLNLIELFLQEHMVIV